MSAFWRFLLPAATALALLPAGPGPRAQEGSLDRPALEELEGLLHDLGFDPGAVDGVVDAQTVEGIRQYQDFALLPGEPKPSAHLLNELRGVAAAFAALNADKAEAAAPPAPEPDEKVIVPPPPAPPKLVVEEAPPPDPPADLPVEAPAETPAELPAQMAELPPPTAMPQPIPADEADTAGQEEEPDPAAALQARVEAELLRFRHQLQGGSLTPAALARQLNDEGRALLQQAQYDEAIVKFSAAVHLDPDFAGAWSNRGTAYQRQDQAELARADFDKARELGFGGFRKKEATNPLR